jgi:hypothetical protein
MKSARHQPAASKDLHVKHDATRSPEVRWWFLGAQDVTCLHPSVEAHGLALHEGGRGVELVRRVGQTVRVVAGLEQLEDVLVPRQVELNRLVDALLRFMEHALKKGR